VASGKPEKIDAPAKLPLNYASDLGAPLASDPGADVVRWLFPAYIFLILVGFFALRSPGVMPSGNDLNPDRAVFTSVNAATLTGFQLSMHPSIFSVFGKFVLLMLIVLGTLFTLIVGGLAAKRILRLDWPDRRLVAAAVGAEVFVLIVGAFASGGGGAEKVIGGMVQTAAAWANSGLYVESPPGPSDIYLYIVLLPLAMFGGLGLVVLLEILDAMLRGGSLSRHSRLVLNMTAALFLIGLAGCVLLQVMDLEALGWRPAGSPGLVDKPEPWMHALSRLWPRIVTSASITSLNARTAGMNVLPYPFPRAMWFFVMLLMMIGASPAGTGGGLKTTTMYELFTAPHRMLRGEPLSRTTGIAATWLGFYLIALAFFQMMLLWSEPQMPGDRILFVAVSALSNVGLSHDVLSMTRASLLLVSAAMFFGRITPLLILWWMVDTTRDAEIVVA
jgi:trk system potassium uptake protein TrkH